MKDITPETILCPVCKWQWDNKNQNCPNCNFPIAQFKDLLAGKRILSDDDLIKEFHNELEKAKKVYEERKTKLTQPTKNKLSLYWEEILDSIKEFIKEYGIFIFILLGFFNLPLALTLNLAPKESRILTKILYAILAAILGTILGTIGNALIGAIILLPLSPLLNAPLLIRIIIGVLIGLIITVPLFSPLAYFGLHLILIEDELEILTSILNPMKNKILKRIFGFICALIWTGILGIIIWGIAYLILLLLLSIFSQSAENIIGIFIFGFMFSLFLGLVLFIEKVKEL
jgi:hypothetical protein